MKHKLLLILFLLIFCDFAFAQTGTIKIAKPQVVKKDTIIPIPIKRKFSILASGGANYTFNKNKKLKYQVGVVFAYSKSSYRNIGVGLEYCVEQKYYELSAYNQQLQQADVGYSKSQNKSEYIKALVEYHLFVAYGGRGTSIFLLGLAPEYMLKNKNESNRLSVADFKQYNLSGYVGLSFSCFKNGYIGVKYSKDIFENLKDRNVYDSSGGVSGKQKSKTNLLTFSITYKIR